MNSPLFLLLARMLPGFGSKFVSVAGGAFKVPFITYLWTTVAANLVGAALWLGRRRAVKAIRQVDFEVNT